MENMTFVQRLQLEKDIVATEKSVFGSMTSTIIERRKQWMKTARLRDAFAYDLILYHEHLYFVEKELEEM